MTLIARPPRWGPLAVVVIVLYLAVQFALQWRRPHAALAAGGAGLNAADTSSDPAAVDRLIARALAQIPPPADTACDSVPAGSAETAAGTAAAPPAKDPHRSR